MVKMDLEYGYIMTRGIAYSGAEMHKMGMLRIHNASGEYDFMGYEAQVEMMKRVASETGSMWLLSETSLKMGSQRVTVIAFVDEVSRNMYALKNEKVYAGIFVEMGLMN
jgi:hypothetical protein